MQTGAERVSATVLSRVGRVGALTLDAKARRKLIALVVLVLAALLGAALLGDHWLRARLHEAVGRELRAAHDGQMVALSVWAHDRVRTVAALAETNAVRAAAERFAAAKTAEEGIRAVSEAAPLMNVVVPNLQLTGWAIVGVDGSGYGFTDRPVVSDLDVLRIRAIQSALSGTAALSEPVILAPVPGSAPGFAQPEPAMYVAAPVRLATGQTLAIVFRLDPNRNFYRILRSSRAGPSEETYVVDRAGNILSPSRFPEQLKALGMSERAASMSLTVADPGGDLTAGFEASTAREQWPLTRAASAVSRGNNGNSLEPYRDYRGVPVVGIWSWFEPVQIGVITEMDARDAFVLQSAVRTGFWLLGLALMIGCVALVAVSIRAARLAQRAGAAEQLGQYRIVNKLGAGGMGTVYRAEHALIRRPTALKVISADRSPPEVLQRFEREVQITAQLSHPNTVAVFDYGHQGLDFYYVMELVDGIDLDKLVMRDGPMPIARAIHIVRQVAGSLAEAHSGGIVHRDIKPGNVMLTVRGGIADYVKVLDFGLARAKDGATRLTQLGEVLGTPLYMAPELFGGGDSSPHSDVYAAGCLLFYLLTGRDAFSATTIAAIVGRHTAGTPYRLESELRGECPAELATLVHRCIALEPAERPADGTELEAALEELARRHPWSARAARQAWEAMREREERAVTQLAETGVRAAG